MAYHYLNKPKTIYFDLGHRYVGNEVEVVRKLLPNTIIETGINLSKWEARDANIPMRNLFLATYASLYDPEVVLVVQKGEMDIPDRSPTFFNMMTRDISFLTGKNCVVSTPFFSMTKTQIVGWYIKEGYNVRKLLETRSCYGTKEVSCGECSACFRRWVALTNNGISEVYAKDPLQYNKIPDYLARIERGELDKERAYETLSALRIGGYVGKITNRYTP